MNKIGAKIFFDNANGNIILHKWEMQGGVVEETIDEIIPKFTALSERNRETFDVLELAYGELANDFREGTLIGVDLVNRIPLFEYPNGTEEPIVELAPLSVQLAETKEELNMLGMNLVEKDMQIMALESSNDFLGGQLVAKDFEIFGLQNESTTQGEQLVQMDIRLMMGGL